MSLHNSTVIENLIWTNLCWLTETAKAVRSSWIERKGNALASGADEGRDKLR